jgi:hypothetical protein
MGPAGINVDAEKHVAQIDREYAIGAALVRKRRCHDMNQLGPAILVQALAIHPANELRRRPLSYDPDPLGCDAAVTGYCH